MPSPIAHTTVGYIIYKIYKPRITFQRFERFMPLPWLFVLATSLSLLPDLDSAAGILFNDFGRYHNNGTHSLFVGFAIAVVIAGFARWRWRTSFIYWFLLIFLCYQFHIILDFFTVGRGLMLFWPVSSERFASPIYLFYGLHWSDGLFSIRHLWTLLNELVFTFVVVLILHFLQRKVRKAESCSPSLDQRSECIPSQRP
jgi:inner membrane protein